MTARLQLRAGREGLRKYVVVGCGGFIGSHLLDALLEDESVTIVGFDPEVSKIERHLGKPNLILHRKFMGQEGVRELFEEAISDADAVINLAAICNPSQYNTEPLATIRANFLESYPIVEMCSAQHRWLIHFSTSEVYGRTVSSYVGDDYSNTDLYELREDETPLIMGPIGNQRWSYACAKQLLERFLYAHHKERGLPFTVVRPLNFMGPRMDFIPGRDGEGVPRVLACFVTALLDRKPMLLVDGGSARRTIISIRDAIRAILVMLDRPERAQSQIFNIGSRRNEVTIAELADLMRRIYAEVSEDPSYLAHPIQAVSSLEFYGEGYEDCDRRMPRLEKAKALLDWQPQISLEDTLRETIRYYYDLYGRASAAEPVGANEAAPSPAQSTSAVPA